MKELIFSLTTTAGTFVLDVAPDGWESGIITFERSEKYFGVFRSWTIPLKFVKAGAKHLRTEFYTYGQAGVGRIVIDKLDKTTLTYITAFTGVVDYTTFKDSENYVEVTFHDAGAAKIIKDYGATDYEIENSRMDSLTTYEQEEVIWKHDSKTYYGVEILTLGFNLLNKMSGGMLTDQTMKIKSDYLENYDYADFNNEKVILVPGAQLNFDGARFGSFKTSFENWFKSINSVFNLAIGIEIEQGVETVRIEPKDYFLESGVAMDFGTVNNLNVSMATKLLFKTVEIGYPAKEYKSGGKETELNATSKWGIRTESVNTKLEAVSKFRGDITGVTDTITNADEDTIDDIWFVHLHKPAATWDLDLNGSVRAIGTVTPIYFIGNLIITPRRNLQRWIDFLSNCTYGLDGQYIEFTSGDNQMRLYESSRDTVEAYADEITKLQLSQRTKFFPVIFEIETAAPADFINTLLTSTNKQFTFTYKSFSYGGYIMKLEAKIKGRSASKITFLASNAYQNALYELINRR